MKSILSASITVRRSFLWASAAIVALVATTTLAGLASAAGLYPANGTFESSQGFSLGDINGQQGWSTVSNGWVTSTVVPTPSGAPFFGQQSMLVSTNNHPQNAGVTTGTVSSAVGPYGTAGSTVNGTSNGPIASSASFDFWFRTGADSAPSTSVIPDASDFMQVNMASNGDRFARAGLFQRDGSNYDVYSDSYKSYDTNNSANDNTPTNLVAAGLHFGQWYHMQGTVSFGPTTESGGVFTSGDTLSETIKDANGTVVGSLSNGGTWTLAWQFPNEFGFPVTGQTSFAVNGLNFLTRDGTIPTNTPLMFFDFPAAAPVPEPGSIVLLGIGIVAVAYRRRRKA